MIRPDDRLADLPMTPVECLRCPATVRVRKSSRQQTSIQWDEAGVRTCRERRPFPGRGELRADDFRTCPGLREAIDRAVESGRMPVAGE
jgi:hypothetical protein